MLFDDHDHAAAEAQRVSPVGKARPSPTAKRKAVSKLTDPAHGERLSVHSFQTLLADLATLTRNVVHLADQRDHVLLAAPTNVQRTVFDLLGVSLVA